jgi:hypothetical protein
MSDNEDPNADLPPEHPIAVDAHGDPIRQGTLMGERESYERVVDGLMIMSEAAAHMAQRDKDHRRALLEIAVRLDLVRARAVVKARITDKMRLRETNLTPNPPMAWRQARMRFRDGAKQAAGGLRQLATCHRGELLWSQMARSVDTLADQVNKTSIGQPLRNHPDLIVPRKAMALLN